MVEAAVGDRSVCQSWSCATIFEGIDTHCPKCGNRAVPQKRLRRLGAVQVVCGLFIAGMMGAVSWFTFPLILAERGKEGSELAGTTGLLIMALFAALIALGLGFMLAGYSQLRHGRQNWRLIGALFAVVVAMCFVGYGAELGLYG